VVEVALAEGDEGMQHEAMVAAFTAAAAAAAGGEEPGTLVLGLLYCPGAAAGGGAWASVGTGERCGSGPRRPRARGRRRTTIIIRYSAYGLEIPEDLARSPTAVTLLCAQLRAAVYICVQLV
jgi:hypothetical protein